MEENKLIKLDVTLDQKFILYLVAIILCYSFFTIGMVISLTGGVK